MWIEHRMQFFSGLVTLLILFCGSVKVCRGTLIDISDNNTQTFRSFGDDRGRQGRPISAVVDVVPTYSLEYRSPNKKEIKFTSGGIYQATIPEVTHLGARVKCDLKMGVYVHEDDSEVQFIITKGNEGETFTVSARRVKSVKDFVFMDIKTNKRLNRESARGGNYLLTVEAQDPRTLAVLDTTELNVSVTDLNDNRPIFSRSFQHVTIDEDIPLHTSIAQVVATDADTGPNGWLYFSFVEKSSFFAIDPLSGVVTVTRTLAGKRRRRYEILVIAKDRALWPSKPASAKNHNITVTVRPVNRFLPEIKVKSQLEKITEGETGIRIAVIHVSDRDNANSGEINKVRITSGNENSNFRVKRSQDTLDEYFIEVIKSLDREKAPNGFDLVLTASDRGVPPRNGTVSLHVLIEDANDMTPAFNQSEYAATISELAPPHSSVMHVFAEDGDSGENGRVSYTLSGADSDKFMIDQDTGLITTTKYLDYETKPRLEFEVRSFDAAAVESKKMATVKVLVDIEDANDNDPVFDKPSYSTEVFEDSIPGTELLTVTAKDQDSGQNGQIQYTIINTEAVPFAIDAETGEITALTTLDSDSGLQEYIKLKVRASDFGKPFRRESETYVHIRIKPYNDNKPVFEYSMCKIQVNEEAPVGTILATLTAVDVDVAPTSPLAYSIQTAGNEDQTFKIDPTNGVLKTDKSLQGGRQEFILYILVTDRMNGAAVRLEIKVVSKQSAAGFSNHVKAQCQVSAEHTKAVQQIKERGEFKPSQASNDETPPKPDNINSPEFVSHQPVIDIREDVVIGSTIAKLSANDKDQGFNGMVLYTIVSGNSGSSFKMDMYTGELCIGSLLDREKITNYTLNITASDCGSPVTKTTFTIVHINVFDVNDNSPIFENDSYEVNLPENITSGQTVVLLKATDLDDGDNGRVGYQLVNDFGGKFRIDSKSGRLSVASPLDYEDCPEYIIEVQAFDNSKTSQRITSAQVIVNLIDINDNAPVIVPKSFNVSIPEDIPVESVVAAVSAEDPDTDLGGEIEFSIVGISKKFKIDPGSGVLRLRRRVDYEQEDVYNLTVMVSDKGTPALTSYVNVIVNILDVNENNVAPKFSGGDLLEATVYENKAPMSFVMRLTATDIDSWYIKYAIIDGTGVDKFRIDPETAVITTTQVLRHEDGDHYWLHVQAKDGEIHPLHTNVPVLITVLAANDDPPYFNPPVYYPSVKENVKQGETVVTIQAHNPSSDGSSLVYSITQGNEAGKFAIDGKTGLIITTASLDREEQDFYELTVTVSDGNTPPQTASITFPVTVTDANDNDPFFLKTSYSAVFKEQSASSTPVEIFRVVAMDNDIGTNAELTYRIQLPPENDAGKLTINPKTGVISTRQAWADGENTDFEVNVTDGGSPPRSVSVYVGLDCGEKNDPTSNPPEFDKKSHVESLEEDADVGTIVVVVSAFDRDGDGVTYSISSGNTGNKFQIDSELGEVTLVGKLDREEVSSFILTIQASDDYNVDEATVIINILDVNDNSPQPVMTEYQAHISEDAKPGTLLTKVQAIDPDEGVSGTVNYAIVGSVKQKSQSLFKIQSSTGRIKTIKALDYEDMREHTLIIKATDQGEPKRESLFSVVIAVDDVNDHKPVFLRSEFKAEVHVDASLGTFILKVFAVDGDDGTNALLKFSMKGGNTNDAFYIDQNSGVIQVASKLSTSIEKYYLQVQVSDSGTPAETAETEVQILVRGIKKPVMFERPLYQASIVENVRPGHAIINVVFNGTLASYELVPQDNACWKDFHVDRKSGLVTNKKPFDAEELSECKLHIRGISSDGEGQTQLIVKIINENDHAPTFSQVLHLGHVKEGLPEDSAVIGRDGKALVIHATDADVSNSDLMFEVVGCTAFTIDSQTGALLTTELLDFEVTSFYKFKVKVSDDGVPSLAAFTDVEVFVEDVNDLPPEFVYPVFSATLYLPTFPGTEVVTVSATDGDTLPLTNLTYSIDTQSVSTPLSQIFDISPTLGVITVKNASVLYEAVYYLTISVSDGNFTDQATVDIDCKPLPVSDLKFSQARYNTSVLEGVSTASDIAEVRAVGYSIGETITYSIVTPSDFFVISESTGVVSTLSGREFDRETVDRYEIVVQARDGGKPMPRVAQSVVLVEVDDVNDNAPKFTEESYFFVVKKSVDVGATVGKIEAHDSDIGNNGEIKYLLKVGGDGLFRLEHTTGKIRVARLLDYVVVPKVFTLEIEAHDKGLVRLSTKGIVKIKVVDKETPIFDQFSYSRVLREDVKVGQEVSRVQARSPGGAEIFYTIVQGDPLNQFTIDLKTGVLTVESRLDYETQTSYQLLVRATDARTTSYEEVYVDIDVTDVNDIAPVFNQSLYLAMISEAAPIGTSVISVKAFDGDSGINKALTYRLENLNTNYNNSSKTSEFFIISQEKGEISIAKKLDYEANVVHELKVIVTDGGSPPLTGEARVRIVVEDANDNPPQFEQDSYATSISGSAGPGFFVTRVVATDPDEKDVRKLRYSISSGQGKEYFDLDSRSGVLTISRQAGIERGKVYDLGVEVTDGKSIAQTSVRVVIGDTNDHSPVFDQEIYTVKFYENYPPGTFVTMVTATDKDSGNYARVRYSVDDLEAAGKFSVDAETGMIYSRLIFDRENSSHAFTSVPIRATDGGGRFGFCTVEVQILDENDNQPTFELPRYEVTVQRATPVGTAILMTSANDADTGSNGVLTYVILGHQTPPVFEIEADTGIIKIVQQPVEKTYMFHVLVKDGGNPQLRKTASVSVNVLSKNAKILQFEKSEYRVSVPEDANVNSVVTTVRASFPGSARPHVGLKIIPGNSPSSRGEKFSIDASGQITLKHSLDYETLKRYVLVIEANASAISQVARTVVIVSVTDVNDNKPHFVANPYRVSLPENIKVGSKVLRVFAEDLDDANNGQILYEFTHINKRESMFFAIDKHTGWITTVAPLNRELLDFLVLSVRATDRGEVTQLSGHTAVHVTVLDVNDSPPKFSQELFEFFVREDALIGQEVGTLLASDEDLNSDIYFFIMSGDPQTKFGIEQKTGKVFVHSSLDREAVSSYKLNVSASDGLYTSFVTLNITVQDANDNPPVCTQSITIVHLSEDVAPGTEVLVVEATDPDADDDGKLRYSVFGQGIGVFTIENGTGRLVTATSLDREAQDMFNFMVSAEDRGGQACFSNVTVLLEDVNDNAPFFTQSEYRKSVYEDARINKVLLQVKADDVDIGKNRKISYSLLDTKDNTFSIESETGVISLKKALNREDQEKFVLTVQAKDAGTPSKSGTCAVVIQVLNINDVPPEFTDSSFKANVSEDATIGANITTMVAISKEAGQEEISYEILQGPDADMFKIDKKTGVVTLQGSLDFETRKTYSLTIQASDVGPPVLTTTASLKVIVTDANDHAPKFKWDLYSARVDENSPLDTFVLQVFATDLDSGSNRDIQYSIVKGNEAGKFKVDPLSGIITVDGLVDHEVVSKYSMTVRAQDQGVPPLSDETEVHVIINDLNDNPPEFRDTNFTVSVSEKAPVGKTIIFLRPHDRDGHGNGGPFTFMRVQGDESKFRLQKNGLITKAGPLDHRDGEHKFKIRVFDSGEPPKYTDKTVTILVVEGVTHPPVVEPLTVYLKLYSSQFNGGVIGSVKGSDNDGDPLSYSIVAPRAGSPFTITTDGVIKASPNVPSQIYQLNVSVTDGKYFTYAPVEIIVSDITEDILAHSLTLRLSHLGPGTFVEHNLANFRDYLGVLLNVPALNIHIWSLQSSDSSLDVVFAVMKRVKGFFASQHVAHKLNSSRGDFQRRVGVKVGYIGVSQCHLMHCPESYECQTVFKPQNKQIRIMSERTTFISYEHSRSHACMCDRDIGCVSSGGKCASSPCPVGYKCADFSQGFQCKCVDSSKCDLEKSGCVDRSCVTGNKAMTFGGDSYIRYRLKESFNEPSRSISLALRTAEAQGTLVFAAGQYDYSILEIVNGHLQLRFDFGSGAGVVSLDWARVDDEKWHHVTVMRQGNHATLILDQGRHRAWNKSPGKMRILNLDDNVIYFGAKVVSSKTRRRDIGLLVENGFKGCLQNLNLNGEDLPMSGSNSHVAAEPHNATPGCQGDIVIDLCASAPCINGGICVGSLTCECPEGFKGDTCEQDTRPCASNPCANNANCTNTGDDYRCHCRPGFSGKNCDQGFHCNRWPCENGGSCQQKKDGSAICLCSSGYTGPDCSQDVDECASSPCQNGGVCVNTVGSFMCNCSTSTHGGTLCEQVLAKVEARRGWPLGQTEIIGIAVVLAILLLIVFLVVIFLRRRAKRRRDMRAQAGAAKPAVLKVSPPVVGAEVASPEPPTPPPREIHGYNVDDLGMPPGYDAEDSWRRREKAHKDFGTMKTLNSLSDNNLPGYQWDYTDIPADLVPRTPLSKEHSGSFDDASACASFAPEVPQRPSSLRSSQGSLDVPEVPKRPRNYKCSESEDGYPDVPHVPKKPMEYLNPKGKSASRYSVDSRYSEFSDATDLDPDIFKGRFPRPPREPYPESLDQHPVGSYAPTLTTRGSELGSITDGIYSEDDLEQVYLGNRMEACDDSPENSYLHSENCSEDEDEDEQDERYACGSPPDPDFHIALQREIKEMMNELEELKMESEL